MYSVEHKILAISSCLECEPVKVENFDGGAKPTIFKKCRLENSPMVKKYIKDATGTAYIKDNMLYAFHYGDNREINLNWEKIKDLTPVQAQIKKDTIIFNNN